MKKVHCFISDYSWLLKLGIWLMLILWAGQGHKCLSQLFTKVGDIPATSHIDRLAMSEMNIFVRDLINKARRDGDGYNAKRYFGDLRLIYQKKFDVEKKYDISSVPFVDASVFELQNLYMPHARSKNNWRTHDSESRAFSLWMKNSPINLYDGYVNSLNKKARELFEKKELDKEFRSFINLSKKIKDWLSTLYIRGLIFAVALFLLRMKERRGIIATALSDKKRCIAAIIFWPLFLMRYPFNVVREIVVEAEIRRFGKLFRRLSSEERVLVRTVAEGGNFFSWIRIFHRENAHLFERSLFAALIATVLINSFCIEKSSAASDDFARAGPEIHMTLSLEELKSPTIKATVDCDDQFIFRDEYIKTITLCVVNLVLFVYKGFCDKGFREDIEHIPICSFLFTVTLSRC